jgi:hypothetical protein
MQSSSRSTQWISRLQAVQSAIEKQIEKFAQEEPWKKVVLVTFSDGVEIIGDGKSPFLSVAGSKLSNEASLKGIGDSYGVEHVKTSVGDSKDYLISRIKKLNPKGQTALGPAAFLSVSIAAASKAGTAQVVLCTDGLANIGVGSISDKDTTASLDWYQNLGRMASEIGVSISVITIADEGCAVQQLGAMADVSGGYVERINPVSLQENLREILGKKILAKNARVKVILHSGLSIRRGQADLEIGNVLEDSEFFLEYQVLKGFKDVKVMPFQLQIWYTLPNGAKMVRFVSQSKEVTIDKKKAEAEADVSIVAANALLQSAIMADKGDYASSRMFSTMSEKYASELAGKDKKKLAVALNLSREVESLHAALPEAKSVEEDDWAKSISARPAFDGLAPLAAPGASPAPAFRFAGAAAPVKQSVSVSLLTVSCLRMICLPKSISSSDPPRRRLRNKSQLGVLLWFSD